MAVLPTKDGEFPQPLLKWLEKIDSLSVLIILSSMLIPKKFELTELLPVCVEGMEKLAIEAAASVVNIETCASL